MPIVPGDDPWWRPNRPWIDGRAVREDGPQNPFDPRPWADYRAALSPEEFAPQPGTVQSGVAGDRLIERLAHCSVSLKRAGDKMTRAQTAEERRDGALDGYAAVSYLLGVLSGEGFSMPPGILDGGPAPAAATRSANSGQACREAGDWVDRMLEKYSRGVRGPWRDAGEGIDKLGGCIRETRENLGYGSSR